MLYAYDTSRVSDIEILDIRSEQIALPQPEINDLTRISKIWSEIGIPIVARQVFDNPALHVFIIEIFGLSFLVSLSLALTLTTIYTKS